MSSGETFYPAPLVLPNGETVVVYTEEEAVEACLTYWAKEHVTNGLGFYIGGGSSWQT